MSARMQDSGDFLHVSSVKKERDACLSTAATLSRHQSWQRTLLAGRLGEPFSQLVSKANLACVYMTVYPVVQATQRSEYGKNTLDSRLIHQACCSTRQCNSQRSQSIEACTCLVPCLRCLRAQASTCTAKPWSFAHDMCFAAHGNRALITSTWTNKGVIGVVHSGVLEL